MTTSGDELRPEVVPGERIYLSHVRSGDAPTFARWFADLELTAYLGQPGVSYTLEQEQAWVERTVKGTDERTFAIVVREGHRLIGTVTLMHIKHREGTAELGIAIGDKSAWGQGYGTEAVRLMTDYGFTFLGLYAIHLRLVAFNERGQRAYEKAGYRYAGRLRGAELIAGQRFDVIFMDILRDETGPSRLSGLIGQLPHE